MTRGRLIGVAVLLVLAAAVAAFLLLRPSAPPTLTGYVEGERLYLASPVSGTVRAIHVLEGDRIAAGASAFLIDPDVQQAQRDSAAAGVEAAQAQVADLSQGQRPQELLVFEAELQAALAAEREAEAAYARIAPLAERGIFAPARLDQARADRDAARARTAAARRRRDVAALGARQDAIAQAQARVTQARSSLSEASARLDQLSPSAPSAALVEEVFFRPGEWAPANQPIVALLPDERVRLVFFVPQTQLAAYRAGGVVRFSHDGAPSPREARIRWISPRPEFTPPVLYGKASRDRLVFRIEAAPDDPRSLPPGLPVDVIALGAPG